MAINNFLPTPDNGFTSAGEYTTTSSNNYMGPGFASLKINSKQPTMKDRTNAGLLIRRSKAYQKWEISISYNSLSKAEFLAVHSFIMERQQTLEPFFVNLPQFTGASVAIQADADAGNRQLLIADNSGIEVGDMFYVQDPNKVTHQKAYQVVRVERQNATSSSTTNTAGSPGSNQCRITFAPGLQKDVESGASTLANFNGRVKVITTSNDVQYTLDKNGLYKFSLKLEEACY